MAATRSLYIKTGIYIYIYIYIKHVIQRICADVQHSSENYYKTIGHISLIESYNLKPVPQKSGIYDFRSE